MIARVPHLIEVEEVSHEAPRPRTAEGLHARQASRRPRHRRQGRQDRRPRHQGPEGAHPDPRGVRGRPAADPRPRPQAARVHQPVPGRVHPGQPRRASTRSGSTRSTPRGARGARPRAQGRPRQGARRAARSRRAVRVSAHGFSKAAASGDRGGRRLDRTSSRCRSATAARLHAATSTRTDSAPMLTRLANIFRVPDLRNKVAFTLGDHRAVPAGRERPGPRRQLLADPARSSVQAGAEQRARVPQPVQRRRALAARDLRARRHALHHELDHHPAADVGHPEARPSGATRARSARSGSPRRPGT